MSSPGHIRRTEGLDICTASKWASQRSNRKGERYAPSRILGAVLVTRMSDLQDGDVPWDSSSDNRIPCFDPPKSAERSDDLRLRGAAFKVS